MGQAITLTFYLQLDCLLSKKFYYLFFFSPFWFNVNMSNELYRAESMGIRRTIGYFAILRILTSEIFEICTDHHFFCAELPYSWTMFPVKLHFYMPIRTW